MIRNQAGHKTKTSEVDRQTLVYMVLCLGFKISHVAAHMGINASTAQTIIRKARDVGCQAA